MKAPLNEIKRQDTVIKTRKNDVSHERHQIKTVNDRCNNRAVIMQSAIEQVVPGAIVLFCLKLVAFVLYVVCSCLNNRVLVF